MIVKITGAIFEGNRYKTLSLELFFKLKYIVKKINIYEFFEKHTLFLMLFLKLMHLTIAFF